MPHVGGGSNSGGFHSGGSHSGGSTSSIRRDIYGNDHSRYYIRPGFYFHMIYVPYSRIHRGYNAVRGFITILILGLIFVGLGILSAFSNVFSQSLEEYSIERYEEIYDSNDSSYEYNVLIEVVIYDDLKELDYMPIVGDSLDKEVDEIFGNEKSLFGGKFAKGLEAKENKAEDLYAILANALSETNDTLTKKYYEDNTNTSKIVNRTEYDSGSDVELMLELNEFYMITGYNICIDVSTFNQAYPREYYGLFFMGAIGLALIIYSLVYIGFAIRAVKKINEADKNGNLKEYYEGDISFEEQIKRHPLDEPYTYSQAEYDELKKEFEINKADYEVEPIEPIKEDFDESNSLDSKDEANKEE